MSQHYGRVVAVLEARHKRTRPYRPQTDAEAERFVQSLLGEWAYGRSYRSNHERLRAASLGRLLLHRRPHIQIDGQTPMVALVDNVSGNYS